MRPWVSLSLWKQLLNGHRDFARLCLLDRSLQAHQFFAKKKEMHLLREGDVTGPTFDLEWSSENNAAAQGLLIIPTPSGGSWGEGLCYRFNTYKVFLKKME
jgi:hypothetical protein